MSYTKEKRLEIYKAALNFAVTQKENGVPYKDMLGLCQWIWEGTNRKVYGLENFPELKAYQPKRDWTDGDTENIVFWFPYDYFSYELRIKILKYCIHHLEIEEIPIKDRIFIYKKALDYSNSSTGFCTWINHALIKCYSLDYLEKYGPYKWDLINFPELWNYKPALETGFLYWFPLCDQEGYLKRKSILEEIIAKYE